MPLQFLPFLFLLLLLISPVKSTPDAAESRSLFPLYLIPATHHESPLLYKFIGRVSPDVVVEEEEEFILYLGLELPPVASYIELVGAAQLKERVIKGVISAEIPIRSSEWPPLQQMWCSRSRRHQNVETASNIRRLLRSSVLQEQKKKKEMHFLCSPFNIEADISRMMVTIYTSASSSSTPSPAIPSFLICHPAFFLHLALAFLLLAFLAGLVYISVD